MKSADDWMTIILIYKRMYIWHGDASRALGPASSGLRRHWDKGMRRSFFFFQALKGPNTREALHMV